MTHTPDKASRSRASARTWYRWWLGIDKAERDSLISTPPTSGMRLRTCIGGGQPSILYNL